MNVLSIELRKEKRTGVIFVLLAVGVLGAAYAFVNYIVRKETLLNMPMLPMDILLTQLYGMIAILNMLGIVVATCIVYNMEFKGNAIKKMYMMPLNVSKMYFCKFLILTLTLFIAVVIQNLSLTRIGIVNLPHDTFEMTTLLRFALYSFITSLPVLSFMLLISSRFENMWIPLGVGVAGFLSGIAIANSEAKIAMIDPFVVMMKPAVAMSSQPDNMVIAISVIETIVFLLIGLQMSKRLRYE